MTETFNIDCCYVSVIKDDRIYNVNINLYDTIEFLEKIFVDNYHINMDGLTMTYDSVVLDKNSTLIANGITNASVIFLV